MTITTVLASASPTRLQVLRAAGIYPVVRVSDVDEKALEASLADSDPGDVVAALAQAKADAVAAQVAGEFADAVVIGCDSMLLLDDTLRGKPVDLDDARRQWDQMAGQTGDLLTGHAVVRIRAGAVTARAVATEMTLIKFSWPSLREIEAYLATGEPLEVAGAMTIDGYGGWFVEHIHGDHTCVLGLSLPCIRSLLAQVGVPVIDLWRPRRRTSSTSERP